MACLPMPCSYFCVNGQSDIVGPVLRSERKARVLAGSSGRRWQQSLAVVVLVASICLFPAGLNAAERNGPIRIGVLTESWGPTPHVVGLRDALLEMGYRENEDFVIGVRFTQGDVAELPVAARELVEQRVDLIFTRGGNSAKAAQAATSQIPIVFTGGGDPVGLGLIRSFARPGGNITGITELDLELGAKRLELFRDIIPGLRRVLFPYDAADAYAKLEAKVYRDAARRLGLVLVERIVRTQQEAEAVLSQVRKEEAGGILSPRYVTSNIPGFVLEATSRRSLPTMFHSHYFWLERGGLASYGVSTYESGRHAARLVDKILRGKRPGEIPVEANVRAEFAINLKVAQTLGLNIVPEVLYRADKIFR